MEDKPTEREQFEHAMRETQGWLMREFKRDFSGYYDSRLVYAWLGWRLAKGIAEDSE